MYISINIIDDVYVWEIQSFYDPRHDGPGLTSNDKGGARLTSYAAAGIEETVLGLSDFGVLEVLLRKGSLPVNTTENLRQASVIQIRTQDVLPDASGPQLEEGALVTVDPDRNRIRLLPI